MAEALHLVDVDTCRGDGICVEVCPEDCLELLGGKAATVESRIEECIECGQCVAVCPTDSLQMPNLPANDFGELGKLPFGHEEFLGFLELRRSIRVFKDREIEPDVTEKILQAAATAPMGMPPHSTEVVVIESAKERELLLDEIVKDYDSMLRAFAHPVGRAIVRLTSGAESYAMLERYIIDITRYNNAAYHRDGIDRYMYRAPMLMLFHANRRAMSYEENAHLVCHHAMLAALSHGLGTTIIGLIPPIVDRSQFLRERYRIPKGNKVITSLILGYPKYRYKRSIQRQLASVRMM